MLAWEPDECTSSFNSHLQMAYIPVPFTTIYTFGVGWTQWQTNKHHQPRFEKSHVMFHCSDWLLAFSPASRGTLIWNLEIKNDLRGSRLIWFCNLACLARSHIAWSPTMPCKSIPSRLIDNKWRQTSAAGSSPSYHLHNFWPFLHVGLPQAFNATTVQTWFVSSLTS